MTEELKKEARKLNNEGSARHNNAALKLEGVNGLTDYWIDEATLAERKRCAKIISEGFGEQGFGGKFEFAGDGGKLLRDEILEAIKDI